MVHRGAKGYVGVRRSVVIRGDAVATALPDHFKLGHLGVIVLLFAPGVSHA